MRQANGADPVVRTEAGMVRGTRQNGVPIFRGIPYAAPPVGSRRFRPPVAPEPWDGIRDVVRFAAMAPQYGPEQWEHPAVGQYLTGGRGQELTAAGIQRNEDCLTVNVLTPVVDPRAGLPVMVYLHGGGYGSCSPAISTLADRFVREQEIVLVSVTHRLNLFGFMYFGDLDERYSDGNVGLLDLVQALHWVHRNISQFGGDPRQVTIFGESGGGWKVLDLMSMPQAAGLFRRAIVESAPAPTRIDRDTATENTRRLLNHLDIKDMDTLQNVPTDVVVEAMRMVGPYRFRPVLDGQTLTERAWATRAPASAAQVQLIIGNCRDEMTVLAGQDVPDGIEWAEVVPELSRRLGSTHDELDPVLQVYRTQRPNASPRELLLQIWSDRDFAAASASIAEMQSKQQRAYRYHFGYPPPVEDDRLGVFHTAEIPLAMRLVRYPETEMLSTQLAGAWASFARTGDPNHNGMPRWEPYGSGNEKTMLFGADTRQVYKLHHIELSAVRDLVSSP